jgi:cation diffusion facilitator CzcD-associated flavoprotein CzcO
MTEHEHVRVAVIGSGFGGLGAAVRLRREGVTDFVVLERADSVGGTWRDNSYPGCACDVPSHLYSFSFAPNPDWPRTFSGQEHIRAYLEHITDVFRLRSHLRFDSEVKMMTWDGQKLLWVIETSSGTLTADIVVSATGPLSDPKIPDIPGIDAFPGKVFHSARWDHDYDLRGKRVAMIGTGASAIQIVPAVQPEVAGLTLFQRTPPWVLPRVDRAISGAERRLHRMLPFTTQLRRGLLWGIRELQVQAFTKHPNELGLVEQLAKRNMARSIKDPGLRAKLTPTITTRPSPSPMWTSSRAASARSAGPPSSPTTGARPRSTRSSSARASTSRTCRSPSGSSGPRAGPSPRCGAPA